MENEKVEPSPNQRAIFEDKTQQDNKTLQDKTQLSNEDITKHYKTGYNQHASPLDCTLLIVRRGNNRIISKVYIDRGG